MAFKGPLDAETQGKVTFGTFTTAQRDALTGVAAGTMIYNSTTNALEAYGPDGWLIVKGLQETVQYFVFTSPGTANLTSTYAFQPDATVDMFHLSTGNNGGSGQGGCGYTDNCGGGGGGGASGTVNFRTGLSLAATGTSFPITTPSVPPVMPGSTGGGGPFSGGPPPAPPGGRPGQAGTNATFSIPSFAPYFDAYTFSNGNGGAATPSGRDSFAGDGGSGGGGGLDITQNGTVPTSVAPTISPVTGNNGGTASCLSSRCPGPGGNGGQGYGAGGGGGAGGAELNGGTSGGAGGGGGAPGIMIIKVTGFVE